MITKLYQEAKQCLVAAGVDSIEFDLRVIFEECVGKDWWFSTKPPSEEQAKKINEMLRKRAHREPLQYILGSWDFGELSFAVGPGVFIPRPETEILVLAGLEALKNVQRPVVFDLCSGSGCVGIAMGKKRPDSTVYSIEKSKEAFKYLEENIRLHALKNVMPFNEDIFSFSQVLTADIIVANPPYIKTAEIAELQKEVLFEPRLALDGGEDGLVFYKEIIKSYSHRLEFGGCFAFEVGAQQAEDVSALLKKAGFKTRQIKDLNGIHRVVFAC
ncbi:MAG: peptide chain release factor N(5)-glutamine methyltransferase [Oscillospiraceae bacterium]|nr:peptide chain release factor N(5)-glutamine methyltransferase [Oscillospiraceae bacterium]